MCLSVPSSSLALISLTGSLANLDLYPSLLNSPPDISNATNPALSAFTLAFDFSASEVTWLGVLVRTLKQNRALVNKFRKLNGGVKTLTHPSIHSLQLISKIETIEANRVSLYEQRLRNRYSEYLATVLYNRARSIIDPAVIAGAFA
ncbi:uncharacterized protein N7518_000945 [Penicillium psychrosexuale]|uniref:uncharacterized protein n=1 Tax=Penicillium psychrosexuale TaxID=1002107 RepID=UPI002544E90C|nr:uncharacterized protein N7518_000945 [Penicillium psychrosexuale]KAJ5804642.1 hypothetical protein N7518_000945 [Penicillium psychrosexuale]